MLGLKVNDVNRISLDVGGLTWVGLEIANKFTGILDMVSRSSPNVN